MSQEQPIMYKDVFPPVHGELAEKAIAPGDAALMQSAENVATGKTMKGGPAAVMQSAAAKNVRSGSVARDDISDAAADRGVSVVETESSGRRAVSEFVAGQDATAKLPADKTVTRVDAEIVAAAEMRNNPAVTTRPAGVAEFVAAAARLNENPT